MAAVSAYLDALAAGQLRTTTAKNEARAWIEMAVGEWPFESVAARAVLRALVAVLHVDERPPPVPRPVEDLTPVGSVERTIAAVVVDPAARPSLWRALWQGTIVLPVASVDYERDPSGAVYRFVTARIGRDPVIFGYTSSERLDLVDPADPMPAARRRGQRPRVGQLLARWALAGAQPRPAAHDDIERSRSDRAAGRPPTGARR